EQAPGGPAANRRRDERAAALRRLDHHHAEGEPGDHAIACGEVSGERTRARRKLGDERAVPFDLPREPTVLRRIDDVHARAEDGERAATHAKGAAMRGAVDAPVEPGHHGEPAT